MISPYCDVFIALVAPRGSHVHMKSPGNFCFECFVAKLTTEQFRFRVVACVRPTVAFVGEPFPTIFTFENQIFVETSKAILMPVDVAFKPGETVEAGLTVPASKCSDLVHS